MFRLWSTRPRRETCLASKRQKSVKRYNVTMKRSKTTKRKICHFLKPIDTLLKSYRYFMNFICHLIIWKHHLLKQHSPTPILFLQTPNGSASISVSANDGEMEVLNNATVASKEDFYYAYHRFFTPLSFHCRF